MNNDIRETQYLALELTKICYPPIQETLTYSYVDIFGAYQRMFEMLSKLSLDADTISLLKSENDQLQKENEDLKVYNQVAKEPLKKQIRKLVEDARGDMEPYVYNAIMKACDLNK
jgi:hypothetical protein